jgi:hypothetical protein
MTDFRADFLADLRGQLTKLRATAEGAMAQVGDADFVRPLDADGNSIALVVKHLSGNLRSRCTNFLTSDGEKPDRDRDAEFELRPADSRVGLLADWAAAWDLLHATVGDLTAADVERTIYIRAEPHTVCQALLRQLGHLSYHVGQIVMLARHHTGPGWRTLTIPRGQSRAFTEQVAARR